VLGEDHFLVEVLAHFLDVSQHVLRNLNSFFGMDQGFFVSVQLGEESAYLHMGFALIL
jgi:hypothetical protein